jgi:hypothetical protein
MVAVALALVPATTRRGVDFVVTSERVPLWVKGLGFLVRDANYEALAHAVTAGAATDEARALAALAWTRANVRDVPPGFPVVDDHIWHIVVRGYGAADQQADVFTTLATYAGVPAYWQFREVGSGRLTVSLVRLGGRWRVLDVHHGFVFRTPDGGLATVEALAAEPAMVDRVAGALVYRGVRYRDYFAGWRPSPPPDPLRAELQMPGRRLLFETRRLLGLPLRPWTPRVMETVDFPDRLV